MNAKNVILTAIHFKGIAHCKKIAKELADGSLCSEAYVRAVIRKVEKGIIKTR